MDSLTYEECKPFLPQMSTAKCVRVYDGDTFHLAVFLPEPYHATRFCCRLIGVDTPELRSADPAEKTLAREARGMVRAIILNKTVNVKVAGTDKYGRLLVRVGTNALADLSSHLISQKIAVKYEGGRKRKTNWEHLLREHTQIKANVIRETMGQIGEVQSQS